MDIMEIGQAIQSARKQSKRSQIDVAAELGMSQATISQIENGTATEISLRRIMRVMDSVGIEFVVRPSRMGYTLEDAQDDLRNEKRGMRP